MKRVKPPSPTSSRRERERRVTPEEAALWQAVASSVGPDGKTKGRVRIGGAAASDDNGMDGDAAKGGGIGAGRSAASVRAPRTSHAPAAPQAPPASHGPPQGGRTARAPASEAFDRKRMRQLASGKTEIDARIDLHGLRQSEARYRLVHFIRSAHDRGCRMVLVITGKGSREPVDRLAGSLGESQRGVLRRMVPEWLEEGEMRVFVIGFTTASPKHGGEGALYVRLRRPGRIDHEC